MNVARIHTNPDRNFGPNDPFHSIFFPTASPPPHVYSNGFKPPRTQRKAPVTVHVWLCLCNGDASPFGAKICGTICDTYMSRASISQSRTGEGTANCMGSHHSVPRVFALLHRVAPVCQAPKTLIFRRAGAQTGPVDTTSCPETEIMFRPKRHCGVGTTRFVEFNGQPCKSLTHALD